MERTDTVAFCGAGLLGSAFVRGLRRRGTNVRVWNRTFEKARALEAVGASAFADVTEAVRGADRVHLCLSDDTAVDAVLERIVPVLPPGTPVIDHTTVSPQGVLARAQRLDARGIPFLHAPVFMGPPQAETASGTMLASGPRDRFERLQPALAPMTSTLRYLGERPDLAAVFKLMGNAMILAVIGGLHDVFRIGEAQGLSRRDAYELFSFYDPCGQIAGRGKRMAEGDQTVTWTLAMARKDARLMQEAAAHASLPVIDAVAHAIESCIRRGMADRDLAALDA